MRCGQMKWTKDGSCKIFDWQFISSKGPYIDIVKMVGLGVNPENVKDWWDGLVSVYYDKFSSTCKEFNLEPPFTKEKLDEDCLKEGYFLAFSMHLFAYESMVRTKPEMFRRFVHCADMAVKHNPSYFE